MNVTQGRLDPLTLMGFDETERDRIIDLCSGAEWDPVQLGQAVMALRPIPHLDWKEYFIFALNWGIVARQAFWLTGALILGAVAR